MTVYTGNLTLPIRDVSSKSVSAVHVYTKEHSFDIQPLLDFKQSRAAQIWAVTGDTNGGVILSAVLEHEASGNAEFSHVLLTYDRSGKLTRLWDTHPYLHTALATDPQAEVFALGARVDRSGQPGEAPFPLLIEYSQHGAVLHQTLRSDFFPEGQTLVAGDNRLISFRSALCLFLEDRSEYLWFDFDGNLLGTTPLTEALTALSTLLGGRVTVFSAPALIANEIVVQIYVWRPSPPGEEAVSTGEAVSSRVVRMARDGSSWSLLPMARVPAKTAFLGVNETTKEALFISGERGRAVLSRISLDELGW